MAAEQAKQLANLRTELVATREKYSADHPDVIKLKKEIASLESGLTKISQPEKAISAQMPDNPTYLTLQAQLQAAEPDMKSLRAKRDKLNAEIVDYEAPPD